MYIKRLKRNFELLDRPIAHKGIHGEKVRANSIEAIKLAIKHNIPFEVDLVQTKDNIPVVYHDFAFKINNVSYKISDYTHKELLALTNGYIYFPTLKEVLEQNYNLTPMLLDFKETSFIFMNKYRKIIVSLLENYTGEYAIQAFNPFFLLRMKKELKNALMGQLVCRGKTLVESFDFIETDSVGKLYEAVLSIICFISGTDYIGLEVYPSNRWNNKISKLIFERIDILQDTLVELTALVTKKPVLGWTVTSIDDLKIHPNFFKNYICDCNSDLTFFDKIEELNKHNKP